LLIFGLDSKKMLLGGTFAQAIPLAVRSEREQILFVLFIKIKKSIGD